jgi:hypothetical protein
MSSTFFTTSDGDVILRAGQEPGPNHDFRVHKFILSLASPVLKDMFTFPQPPNQNHNEQFEIPVVDVPDLPEVLDIILRFVYPGVEPPKLTDVRLMSALLSAADKYNIASMWPVLREALKTFPHGDSFRVYVVACRFGFLEEAKAAAKVSTPSSYLNWDYEEEVRHISSTDLFRFACFVQSREDAGRSSIRDLNRWWPLSNHDICSGGEEHWNDAEGFYTRLAKAVEEAFVRNPCVEFKDLLAASCKIPDPPVGCRPPQDPDEYYPLSINEVFSCPLQPSLIQNNLRRIAEELNALSSTMLARFFEKGIGSG